jgi:natural product biosynthesis luciferase-like monooxygenase protein
VDLSLFYFADDALRCTEHRYRLLMEGARFADDNGFSAVWTPERHFDVFGGLYPNPAVTGAAVAVSTERVHIRAGSVVAPLHHLLSLAEDWSVVDNLSGGRVGISLAPGWSDADFVLRPEALQHRRQLTVEAVEGLRQLWRREPFADPQSPGRRYLVYPPPVSGELPLWLTSSGRAESFMAAGANRTGVLTHLKDQSLPELAAKIVIYRDALRAAGSGWPGHVTLMLHTFVCTDTQAVSEQARPALERYLISAMRAFGDNDGSVEVPSEQRKLRLAVRAACDRYIGQDGLFGSVEEVLRAVRGYQRAGVDELACLIDFGLPTDTVLGGLECLGEVRRRL